MADNMEAPDEGVQDTQPEQLKVEAVPDDMEASVEVDLDTATNENASGPSAMNLDGAADAAGDANADKAMPTLETRIPAKKDASLREFLSKMDDYAPIIPDAVTNYYLTVAGLPPPPQTSPHLARLLALATQKFIADIAADAYQYSRIRSTNTTSNNPLTGLGGAAGFGMMGGAAGDEGAKGKGKDSGGKGAPLGGPRPGYGGGGGAGGGQGRTVLTMEDLGMAVAEYGVNVKRGEFYR